jgi:hypothetical protein
LVRIGDGDARTVLLVLRDDLPHLIRRCHPW